MRYSDAGQFKCHWCPAKLQQGEDADPAIRRNQPCKLYTTCNSCTAKLNVSATHPMMIQVWCNSCSNPRFLDVNHIWKIQKMRCRHCRTKFRRGGEFKIQKSVQCKVGCVNTQVLDSVGSSYGCCTMAPTIHALHKHYIQWWYGFGVTVVANLGFFI